MQSPVFKLLTLTSLSEPSLSRIFAFVGVSFIRDSIEARAPRAVCVSISSLRSIQNATIHAVTFSKHEETPGLGGEITSDAFRDQFRGLSVLDESGLRGLRIVGDGADGPNEVDAISGATMTSDKVEEMLNRIIERIDTGGVIGG